MVPVGKHLHSDVPQILTLLDKDEPCIIMVQLNPKKEVWVMILWAPPGTSEQRKRLYETSGESIETEMEPNVLTKISVSTKNEARDFLMTVEEEADVNMAMTTMLSIAFDPDDGGDDDGGTGMNEDLRLELNSLRAGLEAVRAECNGLRKRLDSEVKNRRVDAGPSTIFSNTHDPPSKQLLNDRINDDLQALKNMILTERNLRGSMRMEWDEKQKVIDDLTPKLDNLRTDFDGLVEIMDEELRDMQMKQPSKSGLIMGLQQSVRQSQAVRVGGDSSTLAEVTLLRCEIEEIKEALVDKQILTRETMNANMTSKTTARSAV